MGSGWFLGVVRVLFLTLLGALVTALRAVAVGGPVRGRSGDTAAQRRTGRDICAVT